MKILIDKVDFGPRQRVDLGDIASLAESLKETGQAEAITVSLQTNGRFKLVTGRRRIAAATSLGWTEIEAWDIGTLTPLQKEELELAEDIHRKERTWWEKALALKRLHAIKSLAGTPDDAWTTTKLAVLTDLTVGEISKALQVADAIKERPDEAKTYTSIYGAYKGMVLEPKEREVNAELERRRKAALPSEVFVRNPTEGSIEGEDLMPGIGDGPTLISIHAHKGRLSEGSFTEQYELVLAFDASDKDISAALKALSPTGYLVLWRDPKSFDDDRLLLTDLGYNVQPWPLIWNQVGGFKPSGWPTALNYLAGLLVCKHVATERPQPFTSIMSCLPTNDAFLPAPVVQWLVTNLASRDKPVLCVSGIDPLHVLDCGNTPVWFYDSDEYFAEKQAEIVEWYREKLGEVELV
jgi:ParB family chromosome partitioning protein